jgi:hypothetical protein
VGNTASIRLRCLDRQVTGGPARPEGRRAFPEAQRQSPGRRFDDLKAAWTSKYTKHSGYEALVADYKKDLTQVLAGDEFGNNIVRLCNHERYILDKSTEMPKHVRIINGTKDTDASRTVSLNCYIEFVMRGVDATLAWSWDEGHVGADPPNTSFVAWLARICKKQ